MRSSGVAGCDPPKLWAKLPIDPTFLCWLLCNPGAPPIGRPNPQFAPVPDNPISPSLREPSKLSLLKNYTKFTVRQASGLEACGVSCLGLVLASEAGHAPQLLRARAWITFDRSAVLLLMRNIFASMLSSLNRTIRMGSAVVELPRSLRDHHHQDEA